MIAKDWGQGCIEEHCIAWAPEDHCENIARYMRFMENFLKSLNRRHWITTSTCDKERRKASRMTYSVKKFSLLL